MALYVAIVVGLALAAGNTWQRLGRTRRARAWSHSINPDDHRSVLVLWPLFSVGCLLGAVVGLAPEGPVVNVAAPLFLLSLVTLLAFFFFPLPVPRFLQPRWYQHQVEGRGRSRG